MENQPQTHNHTHTSPEPPRPPEYVQLPADDYREMVVAAFEPRDPVTVGQRVGRSAETATSFAAFGLLVAGCGWAGVKALNFLEEKRHQRGLRAEEAKRLAAEQKVSDRVKDSGPTPSA